MSVLACESLHKAFGGIRAVNDVSFTVRRSCIKALIGPNGAGKTTVLNIISGFIEPTSGRIFLNGREISSLPIHRRASLGIGRTFQNIELFPHMTVLENVMVGYHGRLSSGFIGAAMRFPAIAREERKTRERALEVLSFVGLEECREQKAGSLAFGMQRLVEVARALASAPDLLLLDEPAAGLNNRETERLGELILRIRNEGMTIILIEHDMDLVMAIADELAVLNFGALIAEGTPREIQQNQVVIEAYLGGSTGA
jgi:ABC-type branched-subunit amino acid transport system ATPase component